MRIANPIYDVVFKYLLEDIEIARRFLSKIIGEEIIELTFQPLENITRSDRFEIIILRLDFKATIKTADGTQKKILIELQKGKQPGDILRFRKYLGDNYRKEDSIQQGNEVSKSSLPITTIYFLGFPLINIPTTVMKVNRVYHDLITGKTIESKEEFVEKLTHDSFIIQISRLGKEDRTELERLLKVFNQTYISDDSKILEIKESELTGDELLELMANRLRKAATEEELLAKVELEEEVEQMLDAHIREKQILVEAKSKLEQERNQLAEEKDQITQEKDQLAEKNNQLEDELSEMKKMIEELKKGIDKKEDN